MEIRVTVPGHMQRGGSPCPYDRVLSTRLGSEAAQLILDKQYGYMVGMVNGKVKKIPLGECAGKLKTVDPNAQEVLQARKKNGGLKARRTRSPFFCCTAVQKKLPAAGFHADAIKGEKFYELYCSVPKIPSFHL